MKALAKFMAKKGKKALPDGKEFEPKGKDQAASATGGKGVFSKKYKLNVAGADDAGASGGKKKRPYIDC